VTTFDELTDDVLSMLRGYVRSQESVTALNGSLDASATTFNVDNGSRLGMGRTEIDDELVYIDAVTTNAVALQPWGRGVDGTTAATHADNARVTFNPLFPRHYVKRAINDTIASMGVELKAKDVHTFTFLPATNTYSVPAAVKAINQLTWKTVGPSGRWETVKRWQLDLQADTTQYATGRTVTVWDSYCSRSNRAGQVLEGSDHRCPLVRTPWRSTTGFPCLVPGCCCAGDGCPTCVVCGCGSAGSQSSVQAGFFDERRQIGSASNVATHHCMRCSSSVWLKRLPDSGTT
jgi:hypothetical protein